MSSGAAPTAISQLQLKAAPAITATAVTASQNLQLPRSELLAEGLAADGAADFVVALVITFSMNCQGVVVDAKSPPARPDA